MSEPQLEKTRWTVRWAWVKGEVKGQRGNSQMFNDEESARSLFEEYKNATHISNVVLVRMDVWILEGGSYGS